jgi:hypothetical protein
VPRSGLRGKPAILNWFAWSRSLEEANSDAEREVALRWPLREFSVQRI